VTGTAGDATPAPGGGEPTPAPVGDALRDLDPAYFGLVMSTGIVAVAFRELGVAAVAWPLAALTLACYALLVGLFAARVARYPDRFRADLGDRQRHWGTLTFVVATNTVGVQVVSFFDAAAVAAALWLAMVAATPLLLYYLLFTEVVGEAETAVSERIDGAFLLVVVCVQSLAVLGALLPTALSGRAADAVVLLSVSYFGAGVLLYVVVVTVVTYRLLDGPLRPDDWTGPYWITMGAAAITTLAGATLGPRLRAIPAWEPYAPVVVGVTFLAWAAATWWIPLLLAVDVWAFTTGGGGGRPPLWVVAVPWARLGFGRRGLHDYAPTAWGRVFPMGMYAACTLNLAGVGYAFAPLAVVPAYWGWFALLVWGLTLVGTARAVARVLSGARRSGGDAAGSP